MKKMMKLWTVVAAAAMGLTACQGNFYEAVNPEIKNSVTVKFVAEEARTSVDTSGDTPLFSWSEHESFAVLEQTDALAEATAVTYNKVDGKAIIDAEFAVNEGKGEYKYITVYPASSYVSTEGASINAATLILPEEQYMYSESSYDPNADLMVSWPVTTSAQPTEAQQLRFTRLAAVVEMSINNLTLAAGEEVESVEFTANGKDLAGTITADLEDPHKFEVKEGVSTVSVTNAPANKVYFTVLPTTLKAEDEDAYSVVVVTNKSVYIKTGVIPEGKSLAFEAGKVTRFGVNMTNALVGAKWKLVRDASELKGGDVVTIVAKNYNYVIGKPSTSVYPLASQTEVVKAGNYLYHNPADDSADHMMQTYTLMQRDANLTLFDFYNGVDYEDDTSVGFAWATGSNNTPKLQAFCDDSTLFDVSIAEGVATITASKISGSYKYWRYYHANYATSRKFDLTSSPITSDANMILLYRLEGAVGEIPLVKANVTVPAATKPVVIAEEGVQTATAIEEVVFNYVGDWKIAVSDNAEWLNVAYDAAENALTYTAEANVTSKREAVVTITASLEGQESLTWTFNMLQKGVPEEVSIADFITKAVDVNVTYKLTGILTEIPSSNTASAAFKISDQSGNTATIKYFYTDGGDLVKGNVDLKLGDVITLTTVVTSSKGQGGSSTYPSYYKGYYRLAVSAGVAADYTGGSVAIEVATSSNGSVTVPTAVEGAMEACDYATFSYDGGNTATVSFTSENTTSEAREATATFTYGLASASVTVQQGVNPANKIGYELVTDASTLAVGDEVIIVAKGVEKAVACPSGTSDTNYPATAISKTGNVIYDVEETDALVFTLMDDGDTNASTMALKFTYKNGTTRYLSATSSTGLRSRDSINDSARFTISIENAVAAIASPNKQVYYNSSTGTSFSANTATNSNVTKEANFVSIYRKQVK
ncbi:MAG: BACON domain-containing protein [Alistipes sp.]|nr:BACON domain-containing protein [Alistipes sp.]